MSQGHTAGLASLLVDTPGRSASSSSRVVQDTWDICREELGTVPPDQVQALPSAFDGSCVHELWKVWSAAAGAGLLRAYQRACGPVAPGLLAFVGRGSLRIRRRRLGGRAAGGSGASKLCRVRRGDDVDAVCAQYFVNSPLCSCAAS